MTKILKDLFRSEKKLGKVFAIITMVSLVVTLLAPGSFAAFWRTLSGSTDPYSSTTDQPTIFKYGWGYGENGWGYGIGYGYGIDNAVGYHTGEEAYENPTYVTQIGAGVADTGGDPITAVNTITMTDTVAFNPGGNIEAILPQGLEITKSGGGTFDATDIEANYGSATGPELGSNFTVNGAVMFGLSSGGSKLVFSMPVKLTCPVFNVSNGQSVKIAVKHAGDTSFSSSSLSASPTAVCDVSGNATPSTSSAVVVNQKVIFYTCSASQFAAYTSTGTGTPGGTTLPPSGGGGGGGRISIPKDSNTQTSTLASTVRDIIDRIRVISRPMQILAELITENIEKGTKTAVLTDAEGEVTLKPNTDSTLWAVISGNTSVTGTMDWDGKIMPPLLRKNTVISKMGETVKGVSRKLEREDVDAVIKVGSYKSPLTFSKPVRIDMPVDLNDGTKVHVLYSLDGNTWQSGGYATTKDGRVEFEGTHFSYFAISSAFASEVSTSPIDTFVGEITANFQDITGHWAESYINQIASLGIVNGKTSTRFAPNDNITRAEVTKIAINAFGYQLPELISEPPAGDVPTSSWYAPYVKAARDNGIIYNLTDEFGPNVPATRAFAVTVLTKAGAFADIMDNYVRNYAGKEGWWYVHFPDVLIGEWYAPYVAYLKDHSILVGYQDGTFRPGAPITRAEVSKIVVKMMQL